MAIFKKILNKSDTESLFPKHRRENVNMLEAAASVDDIVRKLLDNQEFMDMVQKNVTEQLLTTLTKQYDFTPTDKYLEEISKRKQYIGQLDSYLDERKNINIAVENELQMFLQETTLNLSNALDNFALSIQNRIKQAESRHGLDSIKESLLGAVENEGLVK